MSILSVIFAILLFSFLIFVHELGHFVTAKAFNVQVNEFSLFMGPAIWKKQKGETLYALRCIPIGGFCAMEGEDGDSDNPRAFTNAAWWKRVIILVAGAAVNFLVGIALFACVYAPRENLIVPVIDYVEEGSAIGAFEDEVGFRAGDRVLKLDGETIYTYADFSMVLALNSNEKTNPRNLHDIVLLRDGKQVELRDFPMEKREFANEDGTTELRFGITFGSVKNSPLTLLDYAWDNAMSNVQMVRISLQMLFTGQVGMQDMAGPVGIVKLMSDTAEMSGTVYYAILNMLNIGGLIAVNLAVMNLLPIPALDGGRTLGVLLTAAVEGITRKKIDPKYEGYIHGAGMILLLGLMAFILFKDIFVIVRG